MATAAFPTEGTYPVTLSSALFASTAKKRKREEGEVLALRYAFKPASMTAVTEAAIGPTDSGTMVMRAETSLHGPQGFDVREEQNKSRECVLVYDQATHTFTLHPLNSTAHLSLNRSAPTIRSDNSHSAASSETSSRRADSSAVAEASRTKRSRPSDIVSERPRVGGKGIPRKGVPQPNPAAPTFNQAAKAIGRGKANPKKPAQTKKAVKKAPPTPQGKFKSAETIEDSDEEYDLGADNNVQQAEEDDEEDEFAKMLGESLAGGAEDGGQEEEDDDDEEDEDDDDDDELGGARLVVRQDASSMANGESEWL